MTAHRVRFAPQTDGAAEMRRRAHEAAIRQQVRDLNAALAAAAADGFHPWINVQIGDAEPRPYTYIGAAKVVAP